MRVALLTLVLLTACGEEPGLPDIRPEPDPRPGQTVHYPDPPTDPPPGWTVGPAAAAARRAMAALIRERNGVRPTVRASASLTGPDGTTSVYALYDHSALDACTRRFRGDPNARAACRTDVGTSPDGTVSSALLRCREFGIARAMPDAAGALALAEHVRIEPGCGQLRVHGFSLAQLDSDDLPELRVDVETRGPEWQWSYVGDGDSVAAPDGTARRRFVYVFGHDLHLQLDLAIHRRTESRGQSYEAPNRVSRRVVFGYVWVADRLGIYVEEIEFRADGQECGLGDDLWPDDLTDVRSADEIDDACEGTTWAFTLEHEPGHDRFSSPPFGRLARPARPR